MKKLLVLVLALALALTACGSGGDMPIVTVSAGGGTVVPYQHLAYALRWGGGGMVAMDTARIGTKLPELVADGLIPELAYADDFSVTYGENVSYYMLRLFDENFAQLPAPKDVGGLAELDRGTYYVSIVVNRQGAYIRQAGEHESGGWDCVFRLVL